MRQDNQHDASGSGPEPEPNGNRDICDFRLFARAFELAACLSADNFELHLVLN
jgi:hypothetical protein